MIRLLTTLTQFGLIGSVAFGIFLALKMEPKQ